jgi:thioredoxin reductase
MEVDLLIVGAGPAGSSAALVLARCRRTVLLCDDGKPRNAAASHIHGLLTHEGQSPAAFREAAFASLKSYEPLIDRRSDRVAAIEGSERRFAFRTSSGLAGRTRRVLLATGLVDKLPPIPGIEAYYGSSVHHCLYCDGYEYRDRRLAAYGEGDKAADLALVMLQWSKDILVCTDATALSEECRALLQAHGIALREERVGALEGSRGKLSKIVFQDGSSADRDAMFFVTGCKPGSDLYRSLGCRTDDKGGIDADENGETSIKGVFVAGDASRDVLQIAVALGEGVRAAVAINKSLLREDGFCR